MKKTTLFLVIMFVVGSILFLGSGSILAQDEEIEITMSVWGMPWESQIYTDYAIPQFEEKYPNIKVDFVRFDEYWNQLLTQQAGGNPPDVMRDLDQSYGQMRIRGALRPITEYVEDDEIGMELDDFTTQGIEAVTKDGELWGLPQDFSPRTVLVYNEQIFDEAGVEYPNENWSWEDLIEAAEKLTVGQRPMIRQFGFGWSSEAFPLAMMVGHGAEIWSEDGRRNVINSPESVEGLNFVKNLVYDLEVSPHYAENDPSDMKNMFLGGNVAMYVTGGWELPSIKRDDPELDFGVSTLPPGPAGPTMQMGQCIWTVNSEAEHPREAYLLAKHLSSFNALKDYWQKTWVAAPARLSLINSEEFENVTGIEEHVPGIESSEEFDSVLSFYRDLIVSDNIYFDHVNPFFNSFNEYFSSALEGIFAMNPGDVEAELKEVEENTNEVIEKHYSEN